jgi:MFS family permease
VPVDRAGIEMNVSGEDQAVVPDEAYPSARVAWGTVFVLFVFYIFAMVDRQVMTMLVDPIRHELNLSDVQASLLLGLSFALFYTTMGLAIGWFADRYSRRVLIAVSVALWGVASAACGLANSFGALFLARVLVGIGEAALAPAAYSMLSDSFPRRRLTLALAVFTIGGMVGVAIAMFAGGLVVQFGAAHGHVTLPIVGELSAWRLVFLCTGVPGPLIALLAFLIPEPVRTGRQSHASGQTPARLREFLRQHGRLLLWFCIGFGGLNMIVNTMIAWVPTLLIRNMQVAPARIGLLIGFELLFAALPGQIFCGWWIDRRAARGMSDSYIRYFLFVLPGAVPCAILALLSHSVFWTIVGLMPLYFIAMPFAGAASAALQIVTPNEFRGRISALFLMITTLIGLGLGPTLVAAVSTAIDPSGHGIGTGLAIVIAGAAALAMGALGRATRHLRVATIPTATPLP